MTVDMMKCEAGERSDIRSAEALPYCGGVAALHRSWCGQLQGAMSKDRRTVDEPWALSYDTMRRVKIVVNYTQTRA